jgi:hypothetical protein
MNTNREFDDITNLENQNAILGRVISALKLSVVIELVAVVIVATTLMRHSPVTATRLQLHPAPQVQASIPL